MNKLCLALLTVLLSACASAPPHFDNTYTAKSQSSRVKFVIIHYTVSDLPGSITTLTKEVVSSHYLLSDTERPVFYTLVDESRQANHAGVSSWKTYTQLNTSSIGIEIVNPGYKDTPQGRIWYPFSQAQMDELIPLLKQIVERHHIAPENILGHNEIAPQRKQDPGPLFPWQQLAKAGLIPWPDAARVAAQRVLYDQLLPDAAWFQSRLAQHGYAVPQTREFDEATRNVLIAFQMRFRPARFDGVADGETAALLDVLTTPVQALRPLPAAPPAQPQPQTPAVSAAVSQEGPAR
jgi:N-acetylmuramoyl-L-alanine amidase